MKEVKPNYYAIIPASVRYSVRLCSSSKLLYGEITALANQKGYCYASNGYFSKLYESSERSITRWLKKLEEAGFIYRKDVVHESGQIERRLYLSTGMTDVSIAYDKSVKTPLTNMSNAHDNSVRYNNTFNNTLNTTDKKDMSFSKNDVSQNVCDGQVDLFTGSVISASEMEIDLSKDLQIDKVIAHLNQLTNKNFRVTTKEYRKLISGRLTEGYTVDDLCKVVELKVYEWHQNPKMTKYLTPKTLFAQANFEGYVNQEMPEMTLQGLLGRGR